MARRPSAAGLEARLMAACTDKKVEEMASAMQAVCDAAKADKARLEYLEVEVVKQTNRANASELSEAGLLDRVRQLEAALEEQGQKAALSWKWQQEVARLQEKLGKRSLEVLTRDKEIQGLTNQVEELSISLREESAAHAAHREHHMEQMKLVDQKLNEQLAARDAAHEAAREKLTQSINELKQQLKQAHNQLASVEAARMASREKYNRLSQRLDLLCRSAAAAKSLGGGGGIVGCSSPTAAGGAPPAPVRESSGLFDFDSVLLEAVSSCGDLGKMHTMHETGSSHFSSTKIPASPSKQRGSTLYTAPGISAAVMSGAAGTGAAANHAAAGRRCSVSIALAPTSEDEAESSGGKPPANGFRSSLRWSGLSLESKGAQAAAAAAAAAAGGNSRRSSACSSTSSPTKRGGVIARLKTTQIGAAMASLTSPNSYKKNAVFKQDDNGINSSDSTPNNNHSHSSQYLGTSTSQSKLETHNAGSAPLAGVLTAAARAMTGTTGDLGGWGLDSNNIQSNSNNHKASGTHNGVSAGANLITSCQQQLQKEQQALFARSGQFEECYGIDTNETARYVSMDAETCAGWA